MARCHQLPRTIALVAFLWGAGAFLVFALMTWPSVFVSQGRELTGTTLELQEFARFKRGLREGAGATLYRISGEAVDDLRNDPQSLKAYPMWSTLAFDGYERVSWQTVAELESGPDQILAHRVFGSDAGEVDAARVQSLEDARQVATWLSNQEGVVVAGWYTESNYFVYVLDLNRRLLVKLWLLT